MRDPTQDFLSSADPFGAPRDACGVGFVAHMRGLRSHQVVSDALHILKKMEHRGGCAADGLTTDGAGILLGLPHELYESSASRMGKTLPAQGHYSVAMTFLPNRTEEIEAWQSIFLKEAEREGLQVLFSRTVPVNSDVLGPIAKQTVPHIRQFFISMQSTDDSVASFSWKAFVLRKRLENIAREKYGPTQHDFHIASFSSESICYKALTLSENLEKFYPDLNHVSCKSAFAVVHRRFSTNTVPAWPLAQPFRFLAHNGEINTLKGNVAAFHSRVALSNGFHAAPDLNSLGPICTPGMSDSAMFDNALELLLHSGRPLTQILTMMVPEPWEKNPEMPEALRDYYNYQSNLMEPWDGPALLSFFHDGKVGAILDRNGLRPGRYWILRDGVVVCASEAGVLPRRPEEIEYKGRLSPGHMLIVDLKEGRIVPDSEIKSALASAHPYGVWLKNNRVDFETAFQVQKQKEIRKLDSSPSLTTLQRSFGYTKEDLSVLLAPMAHNGKEPDGSMGNDTPLAVLSQKRPLLFNYFRQLFAQVTNPPIDCLREDRVTSLTTLLGRERFFWSETAEHCQSIQLQHPLLCRESLDFLLEAPFSSSRVQRISATFKVNEETLSQALQRMAQEADQAIARGIDILVLSDRAVGPSDAPIPTLLATASLHHHLIRTGKRKLCSLVVESGEPREVHHFALLLGYGAAAICPYLALDSLTHGSRADGFHPEIHPDERRKHFFKAINDGILKIMAKMGISTLQSYRGAQLFEAVGLDEDLISTHFTWTACRVAGRSMFDFEQDVRERHQTAFKGRNADPHAGLPASGTYRWLREGETHLHSPEMVVHLQNASSLNSREEFRKFCEAIDTNAQPVHLRSLFSLRSARKPVPLDEVEDVRSIVKRFSTGAMSFGSLSREAHETIAVAMNRIGAKSNSGEGGEDPARQTIDPKGDRRNSAIRQVASARFGVTMDYLVHADELQIKIAQGAKPGEGGQLPGHKVDVEIARVRHSTAGITLISPPPHHDIYSIEDLAQLIFDLRMANPRARISVKLVAENGVGTIAAGVAKANADVIVISGCEGGTGASPISSIQHAGLPWELGLAETHHALVKQNLRSRVVLQTDGQLRTPRDIIIATLLGAQEWGVATAALITLGCIMMRKCHLNTCPVGIATQDPELRAKFQGQPEHLINYIFLLAEGVREKMAELGFRRIEEMVGRSDLLKKAELPASSPFAKIDLGFFMTGRQKKQSADWEQSDRRTRETDSSFDQRALLPLLPADLSIVAPTVFSLPVCNTDRSIGTRVSSLLTSRYGRKGLPADTLGFHFRGAAGQSFMAFATQGITATLEGECNDYCGKGLSGATVVLKHDREFIGKAEENVLCGNTSLYGATSGSLFAAGRAGERFAVRNSGAHAVVEGVGDHGCEYMTGGSVIVLGDAGFNFAAGMSGGIAYLYDPKGTNRGRVNRQMVTIEGVVSREDLAFLESQLRSHKARTESRLAEKILAGWPATAEDFVAIRPLGATQTRAGASEKTGETPPAIRTTPEKNIPTLPLSAQPVMRDIHG
ncbi:MAG: glutamate synthase large subunit [Pseudomonadota bacterium]